MGFQLSRSNEIYFYGVSDGLKTLFFLIHARDHEIILLDFLFGTPVQRPLDLYLPDICSSSSSEDCITTTFTSRNLKDYSFTAHKKKEVQRFAKNINQEITALEINGTVVSYALPFTNL